MTFLKWQDYPAWSTCAGRAALEESEGETPDEPPTLTLALRTELEARKTALEGATAVEILPLQALPLGLITGERGAVAWGSVILAQYENHTALEVYPPDKILGLAALVKYSILHELTQTNVGTLEELYTVGAQVTEAGQVALNLRQSVTALEHLTPSAHCINCRAAYRCPALTAEIHEEVFGPVQALEDPDAVPLTLTANSPLAHIVAKLPLIEAWIADVKRAAHVDEPPTKKRKRKVKRESG
jgi:hypothetical protein